MLPMRWRRRVRPILRTRAIICGRSGGVTAGWTIISSAPGRMSRADADGSRADARSRLPTVPGGSEIAAQEGRLQFTVNAEIGPNLTHSRVEEGGVTCG